MPSWCFFDGSNGIPGAGQAASSALDPWNVGNCIVQSTVQSNPIHCLRSLLVTRRMVLGVLGNHFTGIISSVACSVCFKESTGSFNLNMYQIKALQHGWFVVYCTWSPESLCVCWFGLILFDLTYLCLSKCHLLQTAGMDSTPQKKDPFMVEEFATEIFGQHCTAQLFHVCGFAKHTSSNLLTVSFVLNHIQDKHTSYRMPHTILQLPAIIMKTIFCNVESLSLRTSL